MKKIIQHLATENVFAATVTIFVVLMIFVLKTQTSDSLNKNKDNNSFSRSHLENGEANLHKVSYK